MQVTNRPQSIQALTSRPNNIFRCKDATEGATLDTDDCAPLVPDQRLILHFLLLPSNLTVVPKQWWLWGPALLLEKALLLFLEDMYQPEV